jgi:predicted house-cleaning noncanonical NTP pyrophosphatase (MazG superfamily)
MEEMKTIPIYARDLEKVREFKESKGLNKLADAVRICIEFSDAHGALK